MNKLPTIILAILGGINVTFSMFTPIMIAAIWIEVSGINWMSYLVFGLGLLATLFRAIQVGFLKD